MITYNIRERRHPFLRPLEAWNNKARRPLINDAIHGDEIQALIQEIKEL
jgi:hypothetical protein